MGAPNGCAHRYQGSNRSGLRDAMIIEAPPRPTTRWRRVAGLDELGQTQGSGLREPSYLIRRADGQVVQCQVVSRFAGSDVTVIAPVTMARVL